MDRNLKLRLKRIRDTVKYPAAVKKEPQVTTDNCTDAPSWPGWAEAGFKTLKRVISAELPFPIPDTFSKSLGILIPDILNMGRVPLPGELLFFDLETTGLSGGAGTVAFLAAFGRFTQANERNIISGCFPWGLQITQYLLLDFPGEADFIEKTVSEFHSLPLVVSYNGKCFDCQILKNRCLMNGIIPPEYCHADLLHPSRRLWKRLLGDCSQSTVEVSVLGLDRTGDVSGALAPDIWFSFLRTGDNKDLSDVCDHNVKDVTGLASLFLALGEIASDPFKSRNRFRFDEEELAILWNKSLKNETSFFGNDEKETGELLLGTAAKKGYPRAVFTLALDLFRRGRFDEGRELMLKIAGDDPGNVVPACGGFAESPVPCSFVSLKAAALKSLAIDAEWRLRDPLLALNYTVSALAIPGIRGSFRNELEKRIKRLEGKK